MLSFQWKLITGPRASVCLSIRTDVNCSDVSFVKTWSKKRRASKTGLQVWKLLSVKAGDLKSFLEKESSFVLLLSNSAETTGKGTVTEEVMNECAHSWQSDLSLPNDNACDLDEGHEKATSGGISFSFLSWGLFPPSSSLSGLAGDVHSDLLLHDALHASAFHGQLLGDGSQGCDEGTFRGESSRYYWSSSTMLHVDDYFYIALSFLSFIYHYCLMMTTLTIIRWEHLHGQRDQAMCWEVGGRWDLPFSLKFWN